MSSSLTDLKTRRGQAWGAFWDMAKIWRSKEISLELKVQIFQTTCLAILLYGCEAWVLTKQMCNSLDSFATSCYRYMLNIRRTDHIRNKTVLQTVNQQSLSDCVKSRQLWRLGHVLRKHTDDLPRKYILYHPEHGRRKRGLTRLLYHKYIEKLTGKTVTN
jgi:Domain of unknown function (DUF6451)